MNIALSTSQLSDPALSADLQEWRLIPSMCMHHFQMLEDGKQVIAFIHRKIGLGGLEVGLK